ncbi:period circadian protein isoform X2 [Aphidius gifuensis]|uniref:period circadian protein isoform X2 n=1 Tax=Aphidius gifuensis TaxID=684658 RepID=UPI001CDC33EA|nr:period circadian protein isoform X2 [Aphidius gifuensis]
MSSTDNVKISDSGYTRENGQSQESGNSLSKTDNKNQSESSGYCGGQPSALGSSHDAGQQLNNEEINDSKINQLKSNLMENSEVDHTKKQSETKELMDVRDQNGHSTVLEHKRVSKSNLSANGFYTIISLSDGIVLHSTVSSEKSLGYLEDSWIGKSFIDYVDPQDRTYFAEKVINNITVPFDELEKDLNGQTINFYCRLRTNKNLIDIKNIDGSNDIKDINKNKISIYIPFYFNVGFKYFGESQSNNNPLMMFVTIVAWPVLSFYKAPEETIMSTVFSTRHTASCHLSYIDDDAVQYFGYLPQDIIGRSLFDFYHPDDLLFIKEVYETVVRLQVGTSFRSKPYRFLSQNGDYVMIETKWSSFINPWTDKIEFITGHHRVLRGPINQNVFDLSTSDHHYSPLVNIGDEICKQLQSIENDIQTLLNKRVEKIKMIENKKSYHLAKLMDTIGQEIQRSCISPNNEDKNFLVQKNASYQENNSVVHRNYCDSKISDRTPSYDQLNYNEKIKKFFSDDLQIFKDFRTSLDTVNSNGPNFDNKTSPSYHNSSKNNNSSGSGEKLSNGSNDNRNFNSSSQNNFKLPVLTEALLHKHNQEMEKQLIQQYTEKCSTIKNEKFNKVNNEVNEINDTDDKSTRQKNLKNQKNGKKRHHSSSINKSLIKVSKKNDESKTVENKNDDTVELNKSNKNIKFNISENYTTKNKPLKETECSGDPSSLPISKKLRKTSVQENNMMLITPEQKINSQLPSTSKINQLNLNVTVSYSELEEKIIYPQVIETLKNTPSIVINMPINNIQAESQATSIEVQPSSAALSESSKKISSIGKHVKTSEIAEESAINTMDLSMHDSTDSSFYGSFLSSSSSNSSKERNKEILKKRLDDMKNKSQRHFSMINDMKANFKKQQKKIRNDLSKEKKKRNDLLKKKKCLVAKNKIKNTQEKLIKMTPSWLEGVKVTPDLTYRYQLVPKSLDDILQADMITLNNTNQPQLVNEQFRQLCIDFEINQLSNLFINNSGGSNNSSNQQ